MVLTKGHVALVSEEDFEYLSQWEWRYKSGYAIRNACSGGNKKQLGIHRAIMERMTGDPIPYGYEIDHKNGNGLDNRRENLRLATRSQNRRNSTIRRDSLSRYKGTQQTKWGRWVARIRVGGQLIYLGSFSNEKDAAYAYDRAAKEAFGEFARLNFPEEQVE